MGCLLKPAMESIKSIKQLHFLNVHVLGSLITSNANSPQVTGEDSFDNVEIPPQKRHAVT